ncbi:glyoxal oxidase precursor [Kockovaella imperatae]|uniref:Glyoxal oxidase n=1 Tax=Kockovaella imperatae TaxID=4999 RepID=A0A1Y1UPM3_9TREE|nr:glyoxal oxidase precursor [Kockovaella imperatae]ORX39085.1 glyoxal oxidase precursor [Kockovaella imperatae]
MTRSLSTVVHVLSLALALSPASAQLANTFQYVGLSGASAQQMFLGRPDRVYIVDKTERNNITVDGHPGWATEYDLQTNTFRPMAVLSNSFCAGGTVLGNGTWLNVGGNQAIEMGGVSPPGISQTGQNPYGDWDGGKALRLLDPCDDETCEWLDDPALYLTSRRWYPTLETLEDGTAIIFGGCEWGGYVNFANNNQNNPTVEFWPSRGEPFTLDFLIKTLPVNLFPLVWLLPSGNIFIQAEFQAMILDYKNMIEYDIADIPDAVRVYPASAGTAVFPLTPENNWTSTIIFCGGTDLEADQWNPVWAITKYPASTSCVTISPDVDLTWYQDDPLDAGRSMGNFINLPDGRLLLLNGAGNGTAGYGNNSWAVGQSYADEPRLQAWYYDPAQPSGSRWSKAGLTTIPRMYHSSCTLLADGSVIVSGSNPNADYISPGTPGYTFVTQYQVEIFYPDYWDKQRPAPGNMPSNFTYGGEYINVTLTMEDLNNDALNINKTKAVIIRTGFSTHTMNMGQRHVELETSFTSNTDGSATLHVAQLPPNPAILVPGPALFFVVVDGVPSNSSWIMVGNGQLGDQPIGEASVLPQSTISAQLVAQYGKRDELDMEQRGFWHWGKRGSLLWDF